MNGVRVTNIRPAQVCDAARPVCPRCGGVLRRVHTLLGSLVARCENRAQAVRRIAENVDRCGQHVHILGAPEGVCIVVGITRQEFERAIAGIGARELYEQLGVFPSPGGRG